VELFDQFPCAARRHVGGVDQLVCMVVHGCCTDGARDFVAGHRVPSIQADVLTPIAERSSHPDQLFQEFIDAGKE
jgi:hypothetical protein